ncbi:hypothetical protein tinsulaeT_13870 [Thalassotalea insulae]|uniref:Uncharacterized protein n=1 Tax=Thalassotalea insulae TaxID=2056778 RepID=A0ABQ6GTR0_9GAMM|nr:hypothetical protein [Thalassotalea insulae]GLX78047.1 hypothetical protein tinsulaeT_13870 [Thalassotalea insulae]
MKSIKNIFVISVAVLGIGTINSASAANRDIEQTMQQVISTQGQQVTQSLTKQLQLSIQSSLRQMVLVKAVAKTEHVPSLLAVANKTQTLNKNNLLTEEE